MANKRIVVDGGNQMYVLYDEGDLLSMSVLVSSSMYNDEVVFLLGEAEVQEYRKRGKEYLDELARKVRRSPSTYTSRG